MFVDLIHNSSFIEKIRFFAWIVFALYMLAKFSLWMFHIRNDSYIEDKCHLNGGKQTQMFVVLEGEVVNICLKKSP